MRILQAFSFYQPYLDAFYAGRKEEDTSFCEAQSGLLKDGFSAIHIFAEEMPRFGYETFISVINDEITQKAWMREFAPHLVQSERRFGPTGAYGKIVKDQLLSIFIEQVKIFKPDIIYFDDPVGFDSRFIRMLPNRPALVMGWCAASIPKETDWRLLDVLVSNHTRSLELGQIRGARWQERFMPGFPEWIATEIASTPLSDDVAFTGSLSFEHTRRVEILEELGNRSASEDFRLSYYTAKNNKLPDSILRHSRGAVWGMEMYRRLAGAKININIHIDLAGNEAANMRLFEAAGVGAFLITDNKSNLRDYFEPGKEIETFSSVDELNEKICYYLENDRERATIAQRGQEKCLCTFTRAKSAGHLDAIIHQALKAKSVRRSKLQKIIARLSRSTKLRTVPITKAIK